MYIYIYIYIDKLDRHCLNVCGGKGEEKSIIDHDQRRKIFAMIDEEKMENNIPTPKQVQQFLYNSGLPASNLIRELQTLSYTNNNRLNIALAMQSLPKSEIPEEKYKRRLSTDRKVHKASEDESQLVPLPISQLSKTKEAHQEATSISFGDCILERRFDHLNDIYEIIRKIGAGKFSIFVVCSALLYTAYRSFYRMICNHIYIYILLGGFGEVYKVRNRNTQEIRALKTISKELYPKDVNPDIEYKAMKALDHPNILRLIEYWESEEQYFLISEYQIYI